MKKENAFLLKSFMIVLFLIIPVTVVLAQDYYKNKNGSRYHIWVYEKPDAKSTCILTTQDVIEVIDIQGGWAKVKFYPYNRRTSIPSVEKYKDKDGIIYGFVETSIITKVKKPRYLEVDYKPFDINYFNISIKTDSGSFISSNYIPLIILILSIISWLVLKFSNGGERFLYGAVCAICIMELVFLFFYDPFLGILLPGKVGWFLTIVNTFLCAFVLYNQYKIFKFVTNNAYFCSKASLTPSLLIFLSFAIITIVLIFTDWYLVIPFKWILVAVTISLIIQSYYVYKKNYGSSTDAILTAILYFIFPLATFLCLIVYIPFLILGIIVVLILFILGSVNKSHSSKSYDSEERTIYNSDGSWEKAEKMQYKNAWKGKDSGKEYWDKDL